MIDTVWYWLGGNIFTADGFRALSHGLLILIKKRHWHVLFCKAIVIKANLHSLLGIEQTFQNVLKQSKSVNVEWFSNEQCTC